MNGFGSIGESRSRSKSALVRVLVAVMIIVALLLPASAPAALAQGDVHTVSRGETLANIAVAYGINSTELARANNVANANLLYVGQQLTIPSGNATTTDVAVTNDASAITSVTATTDTTITDNSVVTTVSQPAVAVASQPVSTSNVISTGYVTVSRGDTLSQIAKNYGMSLGDMLRLNGLNNPNHIWVGQQLRVTGNTTTAATTTAATTTAVETNASVADSIYIVKYADTLANIAAANIAARYNVSSANLMSANGLPNPNFIWTGQRLRIPSGSTVATVVDPAPSITQAATSSSPAAYGRKLIEIDLSRQTLTAWQGDQQVLHTSISSGTYKTPTVTGRFLVSWKLDNQHMYGDDFDLPNVPWVMYFYEGYAIHGAYWHNNFGMPMSHGCVNMVPSQAGFLYEWAPVGTEIYVHY